MSNTQQFPVKITEIPHSGKRRTWTLESQEHLDQCIDYALNAGYSEWQEQEGNEAYTLDAYLDWLRHDLSQIIIEKG